MQGYASSELTPRENARIIKTVVSPRPIAWISTLSEDGIENLAPFSSYNYISSNHPVVAFNTPNEEHGGLKDTTQNIRDTGEFAVNVVTTPLLEKMDRTSDPVPSGTSEFDHASIERAPCKTISPPRVADAVATMECTFHDSIEIYDRVMVLGDVDYYHISEEIETDGKINMRTFETIGRLGGPYYTTGDIINYERSTSW